MKLNLFLLLIYFSLFISIFGGKTSTKKNSNKKSNPKINFDILPELTDVLNELKLDKYLPNFIRMGVTETRLLLRLSSMDFRLMSMEFPDISESDIEKLKSKVSNLIEIATVKEEQFDPSLDERKKLNYGRIYVPNSVQSYEFISASFGGPLPNTDLNIQFSESIFECDNSTFNYNKKAVIAKRGNCTFLTKALMAKNRNASLLVILNDEDRLDPPASGLGIMKNISESLVLSLDDFPIISLTNSSLAKFEYLLHYYPERAIRVVPLKCRSGGTCLPVLEEEKQIQTEVTWGEISFQGDQFNHFEFLTSNFGSSLPVENEIEIVISNPSDGCEELIYPKDSSGIEDLNYFKNKAVLITRGKCRFDIKALNAQKAGARMVIIYDGADTALQRLGGMAPEVGYVGIPSIIISKVAADQIMNHLKLHGSSYKARIIPSKDVTGAEVWIDLAFTTWPENKNELKLQLEGLIQKYSLEKRTEVVHWLKRKLAKEMNKINSESEL